MNEDFREPVVVDAKLAVDSQIRNWAMLCHLSSLIGIIIPLGSIIAPLIVWQMKREVSPFIDEHGKESVNFQLSMLICFIALALLVPVFAFIGSIVLGRYIIFIPIAAAIILTFLQLIWVIMAAVQTNEGKSFTYPMKIRFIK